MLAISTRVLGQITYDAENLGGEPMDGLSMKKNGTSQINPFWEVTTSVKLIWPQKHIDQDPQTRKNPY